MLKNKIYLRLLTLLLNIFLFIINFLLLNQIKFKYKIKNIDYFNINLISKLYKENSVYLNDKYKAKNSKLRINKFFSDKQMKKKEISLYIVDR